MDSKTSPLLPSPVAITFFGTDHVKEFSRVSDVVEWATLQQAAWVSAKPTQQALAQQWEGQRSQCVVILQTATVLGALLNKSADERTPQDNQQIADQHQALRNRLANYASGQVLSTEHPQFGLIQAVAAADPNAGAVLLVSFMSNGSQLLDRVHALDAIVRAGASAAWLDNARAKTIKALRSELSALKRSAQTEIETWRTTIDEHSLATRANLQEHKDALEERTGMWDRMRSRCEDEWNELKRIYDEKLALLAPTEYWRTRATSHRTKAIWYAVAFALTLSVGLALFSWLAIDHLIKPTGTSVVLVLLPVLVPAFAGVWVLRILGRLLSENLAIAQDASERETMVKTFLSLMRDETTGKSVVTDEDRRIILNALFRQSAVTATDDTPPIHWLQAFKLKP
jgi:hypothetical protein